MRYVLVIMLIARNTSGGMAVDASVRFNTMARCEQAAEAVKKLSEREVYAICVATDFP